MYIDFLFFVVLCDITIVVYHALREWEYPHFTVWSDGISLSSKCAAIVLLPAIALVPALLVYEDIDRVNVLIHGHLLHVLDGFFLGADCAFEGLILGWIDAVYAYLGEIFHGCIVVAFVGLAFGDGEIHLGRAKAAIIPKRFEI